LFPISARWLATNVVHRSENMDWYQGATLMHMLETAHIESDYNHIDSRFPVQYVVAAAVEGVSRFPGLCRPAWPGAFSDPVKRWWCFLPDLPRKSNPFSLGNEVLEEAFAPMSVTMTLGGRDRYQPRRQSLPSPTTTRMRTRTST